MIELMNMHLSIKEQLVKLVFKYIESSYILNVQITKLSFAVYI